MKGERNERNHSKPFLSLSLFRPQSFTPTKAMIFSWKTTKTTVIIVRYFFLRSELGDLDINQEKEKEK
jgi:hypothetical protein